MGWLTSARPVHGLDFTHRLPYHPLAYLIWLLLQSVWDPCCMWCGSWSGWNERCVWLSLAGAEDVLHAVILAGLHHTWHQPHSSRTVLHMVPAPASLGAVL